MSKLNSLYLQPCTCTICSDCFGSGDASVDANGRVARNVADAVNVEPCGKCHESGVIRLCARCQQIAYLLKQETMPQAA